MKSLNLLLAVAVSVAALVIGTPTWACITLGCLAYFLSGGHRS